MAHLQMCEDAGKEHAIEVVLVTMVAMSSCRLHFPIDCLAMNAARSFGQGAPSTKHVALGHAFSC